MPLLSPCKQTLFPSQTLANVPWQTGSLSLEMLLQVESLVCISWAQIGSTIVDVNIFHKSELHSLWIFLWRWQWTWAHLTKMNMQECGKIGSNILISNTLVWGIIVGFQWEIGAWRIICLCSLQQCLIWWLQSAWKVAAHSVSGACNELSESVFCNPLRDLCLAIGEKTIDSMVPKMELWQAIGLALQMVPLMVSQKMHEWVPLLGCACCWRIIAHCCWCNTVVKDRPTSAQLMSNHQSWVEHYLGSAKTLGFQLTQHPCLDQCWNSLFALLASIVLDLRNPKHFPLKALCWKFFTSSNAHNADAKHIFHFSKYVSVKRSLDLPWDKPHSMYTRTVPPSPLHVKELWHNWAVHISHCDSQQFKNGICFWIPWQPQTVHFHFEKKQCLSQHQLLQCILRVKKSNTTEHGQRTKGHMHLQTQRQELFWIQFWLNQQPKIMELCNGDLAEQKLLWMRNGKFA